VVSSILEFEYGEELIVDILVEVPLAESNDHVDVSVDVSYFADVNDDVGYSFGFVISLIVLSVFVLAVLEML